MIGKLISSLARGPNENPDGSPGRITGEAPDAAPAQQPLPPGDVPPPESPLAAQMRQMLDMQRNDNYAGNLLAAQALMETVLAKPAFDDPKRLERSGFKVYSQNDEDGILQEIFRRIGAPHKSFVEFGCGDGLENNTAYLLSQGWQGLWMDGAEGNARRVREHFGYLMYHGLLRFEQTFITRENIDGLIAAAGLGAEIDLLSVDIDGNDYHVWQAIHCVNPRVVVVEYNAKLRPPNDWVMDYSAGHVWQNDDHFGASLVALTRLGESLGYQLVGCNLVGCNAFFVRRDLCGDLFAAPATAAHLYQPARPFFTPYFCAGHPPASITVIEGACQRAGLPWPPP